MEDLENKVDGITMPAEDSQVSVENSNESSNDESINSINSSDKKFQSKDIVVASSGI